jgi:hypothetical protein
MVRKLTYIAQAAPGCVAFLAVSRALRGDRSSRRKDRFELRLSERRLPFLQPIFFSASGEEAGARDFCIRGMQQLMPIETRAPWGAVRSFFSFWVGSERFAWLNKLSGIT